MRYFLFILFLSSLAGAHSVERKNPPQYQFSVDQNESGIQEADLWTLLKILDQEFGAALGGNLESWTRDVVWSQPYIGAGSNIYQDQFYILLYGGFVRARYMTVGALSAILCHELGHKLGGEPRQIFLGEVHWSSSEGQADMFAAGTCMPKLYDRLLEMKSALLTNQMEHSTEKLCENSKNVSRCRWVATSGIDFVQMAQVYFDIDVPWANPEQWSEDEVAETLSSRYPSYQCRMDIYKAAAVDPASPRLRCWFHP
ncbi:MAG: hypothetical protein JNL11_13570 [Bdellovibrionaceae bacterium]|nr:hypothetical protein [Pseudobdellovibrionaceae bacterium]